MTNLIVVIGMLWLNSVTNMPLVNGVIFGIVFLLLRLMFGDNFSHALIGSVILAVITVGLFWLLKKLQTAVMLLWLGALALSFVGLMIVTQLV